MDVATMERSLDLLTPDEAREALWFVDVCQRFGAMDQTEADEWRQRIVARQRFLELDGTASADA